MKIRLLGWLAGVAAVAAAASPGCSQPKPECTVGNAAVYPFATKFFVQDEDADKPCGQIQGLTVGLQVYNPNSGGYPDRNTKLVAIQTDRTEWTANGETIAESPDRKDYALGTFESIEPDGNDICRATTLSPAEVMLVPPPPDGEGGGGEGGGGTGGAGGGDGGAGGGDGGAGGGDGGAGGGDGGAGGGDGGAGGGTGGAGGGDGGAGGGDGGAGGGDGGADGGAGGAGGEADGGADGGGEPADGRSLKYEWSNLEVYVTAANLGNTFQADLTYTEGTCTAKYRVVGLWPQVGCEKLVEQQMVDPETDEPVVDEETGEPVMEVVATGEPEDKLCDNTPDPEPPYFLPWASGISEDLKVKCDPVMLVCVLDSDKVPALK
ncbi:hypothetical protein [Sorangium sp. So ce1335]|uniref:hypothetical protein n=1 Tax=Sorangium sp. So ce1335 TaxID=3133335 RepID=UPI003F61033D